MQKAIFGWIEWMRQCSILLFRRWFPIINFLSSYSSHFPRPEWRRGVFLCSGKRKGKKKKWQQTVTIYLTDSGNNNRRDPLSVLEQEWGKLFFFFIPIHPPLTTFWWWNWRSLLTPEWHNRNAELFVVQIWWFHFTKILFNVEKKKKEKIWRD